MDELNKSMEQYYGMISAADEANRSWSAEQAQKQMDFQERMSNSSHQREVEDLKKAGLNPVLSAGGAGATTGSGAMASTNGNNVDALFGLVSQAFKAQIENAKAEQASAKAMAGAAGYASTGSYDGTVSSVVKDIAKRKLGLSNETVDKVFSDLEYAYDYLNDHASDIKLGFNGQKNYLNQVIHAVSGDQSALDFLLADANKNGYLDQREMAKFLYENGHLPGDESYKSSASSASSVLSRAQVDEKLRKHITVNKKSKK